jgi:hypothetical protein
MFALGVLIGSLIPLVETLDSGINISPPFAPTTTDAGCCPSFYDPVCEVSPEGVASTEVYPNVCWAELIGISNVTECALPSLSHSHENEQEHPRKEGALCSKIYQPVCASNGQTFPNECEAQAYDMEVVSQGECPLDPISSGQDEIQVCPF